jgi:2,4-dienoyl-CoA reductase-like NADH-dependent reductase (Old Yellow Enzyme family)
MADLFSPLTIAGHELPNRIVFTPTSSAASADGFVGDAVVAAYARQAPGDAGLVLSEPLRVIAPRSDLRDLHLGIYADAFVPGLRRLVASARAGGACVLLTLDEPDQPGEADDLGAMAEAFVLGAWRARCAGADGVMLTAADGGALYSLLSPLRNRGAETRTQSSGRRQQLILSIVEGMRSWLGRRLIIGFRLLADEFTPGGLTLQDARVLAKRLTAAGVRLLEVSAPTDPPNVARFPGWTVPLANSIRRVVDVPVIGSGEIDDRGLADSIVRDGSVDLVRIEPGPG